MAEDYFHFDLRNKADSDCTSPSRTGSRADFFTFNGSAGQTVTITLHKNSLDDPYLFLIGPSSGGPVILRLMTTSYPACCRIRNGPIR
jgi:hypothetical protein